jgi:hypothetical protein
MVSESIRILRFFIDDSAPITDVEKSDPATQEQIPRLPTAVRPSQRNCLREDCLDIACSCIVFIVNFVNGLQSEGRLVNVVDDFIGDWSEWILGLSFIHARLLR